MMSAAPTTVWPSEHAATKASLRSWWKQFTTSQKIKEKDGEEGGGSTVFGVPLRESLKYASVHISTANANGELYIWGYIPVVVAKCGLYLKENSTEVPGTFRVNGSNKRMRELQALFEAPPRYGKDLDWTREQYISHDVASVFRRYLTQMPEPVIPHESYHEFRDALAKKPVNEEQVIATYKRLIQRLPRANQYLLLYVLDLLSVFARKSDVNLMTATNLAVIFRPGLIAHPTHEMSPEQHALSQQVLEFLIAHQDWFMLDIAPPAQQPSRPLTQIEADGLEGDGWRIVDPSQVRRRASSASSPTPPASAVMVPTQADPSNPSRALEIVTPPATGSSSVAANATATGTTGGASVTRSKTLPSKSTRGGRHQEPRIAGVLRKKGLFGGGTAREPPATAVERKQSSS
ncbi:Rho GTPase activation protein [Auriculariales sp. MPI-PUGE-AT-0066]|nr:Rho GTPase activation protein [Auriculariales sp. MPI-PUGE-AT-0066]